MTPTGTKMETTLTEKLDEKRAEAQQVEVIPPKQPLVAEILPPEPGSVVLQVAITLAELGVIASSLQTCVHMGAIRQNSHINLANSVLRKFHDAKQKWVEEHP